MKRILLIVSLLLALLLIIAAALATTQTGLRLVARLVLPSLPGQIAYETLDGRLIGPLQVTGLHWESGDRRLTVERAALDWRPARLVSRHLQIERLEASGLHWQAPGAEAATDGGDAAFSPPALPLTITAALVQIDDILIEQGELIVPVGSFAVAGKLDHERYSLEKLAVESKPFDVSGAGWIGLAAPHEIETGLSWTARIDGQDLPVSGTTEASGTLEKLKLRATAGGPFDLTLSGTASNLLNDARVEGDLDIARLDPAVAGLEFDTGVVSARLNYSADRDGMAFGGRVQAPKLWPAALIVETRLRLRTDTVEIAALRASLEDRASRIEAAGTLRKDLSDLNLELKWTDLAWPPGDAPRFASSRGAATLTGSKDRYRLALNGTTEQGLLPAAAVALRGDGTASAFEIAEFSASFDRGRLTGRGTLDWAGSPNARLEVSSENLELSQWHKQLEGTVGFDSVVTASLPPEGAQVSVDLRKVSGRLRGYALTGAGSFAYAPGTVRFRNLDVRAGAARLSANGQIGERVDLAWKLSVPDIALFVPGGTGLVNSQGTARGRRGNMGLTGDLNMQDVRAGNYSAARVDGRFDIGVRADANAQIDLRAAGIELGPVSLTSLSANTEGSVASHTIDVAIDAPAVKLETTLQGGLDDEVWQGQITQLAGSRREIGVWRLADPSPLTIRRDRIALTQTCLVQNDAKFCATGEFAATQPWRSEFELTELPLQLIASVLPPDLVYEGTISGQGHVASSGSAWAGAARLQLPSGRVLTREESEEDILIAYRDGLLEADFDPAGVRAKMKLDLRDAGMVDANVTLPARGGQLAGTVQARIENLSIVTALVPQIGRIDGRLDANLVLAGTMVSPDLSGQIGLQAAELVLPDLGIVLRDTAVNVVTSGNDLRFDGRAGSGEGHVALTGDLRWQQGRPDGQLRIDGERFRAVDLPEILLDASPSLTLAVDGRKIDVAGTITVPAARITPIDIASGVTVSPDQVIVGQSADSSPEARWRIGANVTVTAGDAVHIKGYGLQGKLSGSVLIIEEPNRPTIGRGSLEIADGRYRAYGQELQIETGRLTFTGGQLDDPGVNLRAVRKAGDVVAGAQVRGALRSPVLTLYSVPPMSDTQAMSYLITGRGLEDLNEMDQTAVSDTAARLALQGGSVLASSLGRGLGLDSVEFKDSGETASTALVVGKHLSPRLFVSYGIGLFEAINTLRLRYRINSRLTLETQSGTRTSADLLYSIER